MKDNFDAYKEDSILKNLENASNYVKAKTSMELELYKASKRSNDSVVNDSMRQIDNPFAPVNSDFGNNMERGNVRVLTRDYPGNVPNNNVNNQPVTNNYSQSGQYYGGGYSTQNTSGNFPNMMGSANMFILAGISALVLLVTFISLFVMNYIGF